MIALCEEVKKRKRKKKKKEKKEKKGKKEKKRNKEAFLPAKAKSYTASIYDILSITTNTWWYNSYNLCKEVFITCKI